MSDLNDNREGGLFSDDYEIPKRENPYKKKKKTEDSEDKAALHISTEDKPVVKARENPYTRKKHIKSTAVSELGADVNADAFVEESGSVFLDINAHSPTRQRKSLKERWNDFIFSHVKLICFIGGVIVVLLFIFAPAIYDAVKDAREQAEQESKEPLTLNYVMGLADKASPITWSDLVGCPYDETIASDSVTWMIKVDKTNFEVWISGVSTQKLPTYVYLYDMGTGDKVDLTRGLAELERFLAGRME